MKTLLSVLVGLSSLLAGMAAEQKPIAVTVGQEFKITLDSARKKGCQWLLAKPLDEGLLRAVGNDKPTFRFVEGKNVEILSFKAMGEGKAQIQLKYASLWEPEGAATPKTNFVIVVTKPR